MRGALAVALLLLAASAFAQAGEKITVNVIEVPVTVIDREGNAVRGLTAANFELLDNGRAQKITGFEQIDFAATENVSAITPLHPAARRSFMLLFDLGFSSPTSLARAQEAARRFVAGSVKPRDLVAVGSIEPERGFRLLTAFTTDRELVAAAIKDPASFRGTDPLQLASGDAGAAPAWALTYANEQPVRASPQHEEYVRGRVDKEIEALGYLAATLRAVPGPKQIVMLSEGFEPKVVRPADVPTVRRHGYVAPEPEAPGFDNSGTMKIVQEMAREFRASEVVLHAIDIESVRVENSTAKTNDALYVLTESTGGEVFRNANDLSANFERMLARQEVVYVLSFHGASAKAGRFHELKVNVTGVPAARVSHRAGYVEAPAETPVSRVLSNAEVIVNDIAQDDIRVAEMASAFPDEHDAAQVPVIVEMNGADLLHDAKGDVVAAEIYLYAFDDEGLVRDRLYQRMTLDLGKVGARLRSGGIKFYATLALPPGTYAIKSLVKLADSDRRGFARTDLVVPKRSDVAIMPFFIDEHPSDWLMVRGTSHASAPYPFAINGESLIPAAAGRGAKRKLALVVLNAAPDEITIDTTPQSTVVTRAAAGTATKVVLEVSGGAVDVAVRKAGGLTMHVVR